MTDFVIENNDPSGIKKSGRRPSSEEYEIGTKIYQEFKVGNCSFFSSDINYKSLLSRLDRLNKKNETEYEFTVRKDNVLGELIGGVRSIVEGFKIYRIK